MGMCLHMCNQKGAAVYSGTSWKYVNLKPDLEAYLVDWLFFQFQSVIDVNSEQNPLRCLTFVAFFQF